MSDATAPKHARGTWTDDEHDRFLEAFRLFPNGPWQAVADMVGTRTVRQVQTHALAAQERAARQLRDLRLQYERVMRSKQALEDEMREICKTLQQYRVPLSPPSAAFLQRSLGHTAWMTLDPGTTHSRDTLTFDECLDFLVEALASGSEESSDFTP